MATCFTADIYDGKPITFEQFLWRCAMSMDKFQYVVEPTDTFEYKHHSAELAKAHENLQNLAKMTNEEIQQKVDEDYIRDRKYREEHLPGALARAARFREFHAMAQKWQAPTEKHAWLKKRMLEQLGYDVRTDDDVSKNYPFPIRRDTNEWVDDHREMYIRDISYHSKCLADSMNTVKERNEWVKILDDVVMCPEDLTIPDTTL